MILHAITVEDVLLAYGPLGLGVLVLGWFGIFMFKRLVAELDHLRAERDRNLQTMLEMVPLMRRSAEIHEKRQVADEMLRSMLTENTEVLKDVRRHLESHR